MGTGNRIAANMLEQFRNPRRFFEGIEGWLFPDKKPLECVPRLAPIPKLL
jgi:hypothetical protein